MTIRGFLSDTFYKASTAISATFLQVSIKTRYAGCKIIDTEHVFQNNSQIGNQEKCLQAFKNTVQIVEEIGKKIIFDEAVSEDKFHSKYDQIFRDDAEFSPSQCYEAVSSAIRSIEQSDIQDSTPKYTWLITSIGLVAIIDAVFKRYNYKEHTRLAIGSVLAGALAVPVGVSVLDGMAAYWTYKVAFRIASMGYIHCKKNKS